MFLASGLSWSLSDSCRINAKPSFWLCSYRAQECERHTSHALCLSLFSGRQTQKASPASPFLSLQSRDCRSTCLFVLSTRYSTPISNILSQFEQSFVLHEENTREVDEIGKKQKKKTEKKQKWRRRCAFFWMKVCIYFWRSAKWHKSRSY